MLTILAYTMIVVFMALIMTKRLSVCPGMTGLWQVSGRSDLTFDEMVLLDIYYVENWTMGLDLNILLRSVPAVLQAVGCSWECAMGGR